MKAIKKKIYNAVATSIYLNPDGGFNGYDVATDKIMKILEEEDIRKTKGSDLQTKK